MNKFFIFILALSFLLYNHAISQNELTEDLVFNRQSQIDSCPINYPNVSIINGTVEFRGEDIVNFDSLISINHIQKSLLIYQTHISSVSGFNNLKFVGYDLVFGINEMLNNTSDFNSLDSLGGGLVIYGNDSLISLSGFEKIKSCYLIEIGYNYKLKNLIGFDSLTTISSGISVYRNMSLEDFTGLTSLKKIYGPVHISENFALRRLVGLENLEYIEGDLVLYNNKFISDLDALSNLDSIKGDLRITEENSLSNILGLSNIAPQSIENLTIAENDSLTNCHSQNLCEYLSNPNGIVKIYNNSNGCDNPPEIAEDCGFDMPCLPWGDYYLTKQIQIDSFQFDYPGCSTLKGEVFIEGDDIYNLSGLLPVTKVSGKLILVNNPYLVSLGGLDSLTEIYGQLFIGGFEDWPYDQAGNPLLTDLSALSNLDNVMLDLTVAYNNTLESLFGLENVQIGGAGTLYIFENPQLSKCEVKSICNYLDEGRDAEIELNSTGCNSIEEVEYACLVSIEEMEQRIDGKTYPNPFTTSTNIEYTLSQSTEVTISFFNQFGKQVDLIHQKQQQGKQQVIWNTEGLPAGIYFFRLQAGDHLSKGKIVKID